MNSTNDFTQAEGHTAGVSDPTPPQLCDVCGALIPEGLAVYTMLDALTGPVTVMCRDCAALDEQVEDAVDADDPDIANP